MQPLNPNQKVNNLDTQPEGKREASSVTAVAYSAGLLGKYFSIFNALGAGFYVWFDETGHSGVDPAVVGQTAIPVVFAGTESAAQAAAKIAAAIAAVPTSFAGRSDGALVEINNVEPASATDIDAGTSGLTVAVVQQGTTQRFAPRMAPGALSLSPGTF